MPSGTGGLLPKRFWRQPQRAPGVRQFESAGRHSAKCHQYHDITASHSLSRKVTTLASWPGVTRSDRAGRSPSPRPGARRTEPAPPPAAPDEQGSHRDPVACRPGAGTVRHASQTGPRQDQNWPIWVPSPGRPPLVAAANIRRSKCGVGLPLVALRYAASGGSRSGLASASASAASAGVKTSTVRPEASAAASGS